MFHPLHIVALREFHELFVIHGAPCHCADPVQLDQSRSRVQSSRRDRSSTPSFLDHAIHFTVLPHDPATQSFPSGCCSPTVSSRHRAAFLEDQSLLVGMNAFLVFTSSMVSLAFDIECSCLTSQRLDDDLPCHHTIGPVCCVRVPCSTSYSASCVQNAPSIFWHASWSSPSPPCC